MPICLDVERWRISSSAEVSAFLGDSDKPDARTRRQLLAVRTHLKPVNVYTYLKARFGESSPSDIAPLAPPARDRQTLTWGRDRIGVGLLKALRAGLDIVFEDKPSPYEWVPPKNGHIVVCEEGEELSQVIAANYAFALDAGLFLIPAVDDDLEEELLEGFYNAATSRLQKSKRD